MNDHLAQALYWHKQIYYNSPEYQYRKAQWKKKFALMTQDDFVYSIQTHLSPVFWAQLKGFGLVGIDNRRNQYVMIARKNGVRGKRLRWILKNCRKQYTDAVSKCAVDNMHVLLNENAKRFRAVSKHKFVDGLGHYHDMFDITWVNSDGKPVSE